MAYELSMLITPTKGRIVPQDSGIVSEYLRFKDGIPQIMTIRDYGKRRTRGRQGEDGNQDGFLFGKVIPKFAAEIYFTVDLDSAYSDFLKDLSFVFVRNPNGGHPLKKLIHVSALDRAGMSSLIERALIFAGEKGVVIDDPDKSKSRRIPR